MKTEYLPGKNRRVLLGASALHVHQHVRRCDALEVVQIRTVDYDCQRFLADSPIKKDQRTV